MLRYFSSTEGGRWRLKERRNNFHESESTAAVQEAFVPDRLTLYLMCGANKLERGLHGWLLATLGVFRRTYEEYMPREWSNTEG